jgi:TonB family protein
VRVHFAIGPGGEPESIQVVQKAGLGLDEAAVGASRQWQFTPGIKDGRAVLVEADVDFTFRTRGWRVTRMTYSDSDNTPPPTLKFSFLPLWGETCGEVSVHLQIQKNGFPADLRVKSSTNESMREAAMEFLPGWPFFPPRKGGSPIAREADAVMSCEPWPGPFQ